MTASAQEDDVTGKDTLHSFSRAYRFNRWMFERIYPWVKEDILEAGSGIGNISKLFIKKGCQIVLTDIRRDYLLRLQRTFGKAPQCKKIVRLDLSVDDIEKDHPTLIGQFQSVVALNVVEHIENDRQAIINCKKLLKNGGRMIILVPAFPELYNPLDKDLQHFRRYTKKSVSQLLAGCGFKVVHTEYFNLAGMVGWFVSGTLLKHKKIPASQLRIFEKLVPLFRLTDKLLLRAAGVSVIAVGENVG